MTMVADGMTNQEMLGSTCATLGSWKVSDCGNFVKTHQN